MHLRIPHTVFPRLCPANARQEAMKTKLKLKLVVVLSFSILFNVFLMWEVQRKTNMAEKREKELAELRGNSN